MNDMDDVKKAIKDLMWENRELKHERDSLMTEKEKHARLLQAFNELREKKEEADRKFEMLRAANKMQAERIKTLEKKEAPPVTNLEAVEYLGITFYGVFSHGIKGKYNGLPENCWPDEPAEFDIHYAKVGDIELDAQVTELISDRLYEEITKAAEEAQTETAMEKMVCKAEYLRESYDATVGKYWLP